MRLVTLCVANSINSNPFAIFIFVSTKLSVKTKKLGMLTHARLKMN